MMGWKMTAGSLPAAIAAYLNPSFKRTGYYSSFYNGCGQAVFRSFNNCFAVSRPPLNSVVNFS